MDVPLTFFMSLALYFFWRGRERNRYLIFSGIAIGLAVMTKGFAAFFIFPIVWIACVLSGELEVLTRSSYWIGVMIAVVIALPWHLIQLFIHREIFLNEVITKHLLGRPFNALEGHGGHFDYYFRTLVNKYRPWILIGIISAPFFLIKAFWERTSETIFLAVWIFFTFLAVTLIKTKLRWYILPIYPPLSLTVAYLLARMFGEKQKTFIRLMFLTIMALHIPYTLYAEILGKSGCWDMTGIAPLVQREVPPNGLVYLYNYHETPAALFYLDRNVSDLEDPAVKTGVPADWLIKRAREDKTFYCLIHDEDLAPLMPRLPQETKVLVSFENLRLLAKK